jgi:hypothetical protein
MDHATLVSQDHRAIGRVLVERLEASGFPIYAAFWHWDPEAQEDRLAIASPVVAQQGPRAVYDQIETVLRAHPEEPRLPFSQIELLRTDDPAVGALHALRIEGGPGREARVSAIGSSPTLYDVWIYRHPRQHPDLATKGRH